MQNVKAKAIYDNMAESVDELAFRRGDILDVVEQNADGLDGWWLCSLRGRVGLCPGNRLRVIDYETSSLNTPTSPLSSPCSNSMSMSVSTLTFSSQTSELYENTATAANNATNNANNLKGKRRSWHMNPNRVSSNVISIKFSHSTLNCEISTKIKFTICFA
jgi:enhancer-of-filamentation protein 1